MGKLLLAMAVLGSFSLGGPQTVTTQETIPEIIISPVPPKQGRPMTVKYTGPKPITLDIDWDPAGKPSTVTITNDKGTDVTVPGNANSVIITDPTGAANPTSSVVVP